MPFERARTLQTVPQVVGLEPLESGDPRYAELGAGHASEALDKLRLRLRNLARSEPRAANEAITAVAPKSYLLAGFTGHRGCGKTTELHRLEDELRSEYVVLHLTADEQLIADVNYPWVFLWLADSLVQHFEDELKISIDPEIVGRVVKWFANTTSQVEDVVKKDFKIEAEAGGGADSWWFGLRAKFMASIKSLLQGSHESRVKISSELQKYSNELKRHLNDLLAAAYAALRQRDFGPQRILVIVDNLDRLDVGPSEAFFFKNSDMLSSLNADLIYTVPVAISMDRHIRTVFPLTISMPMVKLRDRNGKRLASGRKALMESIRKRVVIEEIFEKDSVAELLCDLCGGSIRDLMRLLDQASVEAGVRGLSKIDRAAAKRAVTSMRLEFERYFFPHSYFYPRLARLHLSKGESFTATTEPGLDSSRDFLRKMLLDGAVLEYNGDEHWYDVHPLIQEIAAFQKQIELLQASSQPSS